MNPINSLPRKTVNDCSKLLFASALIFGLGCHHNKESQLEILPDLTYPTLPTKVFNANLWQCQWGAESVLNLKFHEEGFFSAFAGCNQMRGQWSNTSPLFSSILSTRKACPEPLQENDRHWQTRLENSHHAIFEDGKSTKKLSFFNQMDGLLFHCQPKI